jgi:hypothetical protein
MLKPGGMCSAVRNAKLQQPRPAFLKLGSESRTSVMAVEFYWRSEICMYELNFVWRHSTLIISSLVARNQSMNQSNAASFQHLPDSAVQSVSTAGYTQSMCRAKRSG